ncbi:MULTISPECIES: hypothetical protein [unclassified Polaribacter]|uniref:hypothetical protein n=1 Tax=unclassified Polaribacter TaxID=196858 RepID=UPI0011BFABDE|nr:MULTISPECIES: hypothetical protein [unclassified Polaribacter]TXD48112.1 hypothetical protein ES043_18035 [Polaribacter sp. IC063]TXD55265.1 hypothetical protein ES044_18135 [Polaribacter sp. IC066]
MKYIEIINSVILIVLTVAFFIQNNSLKFMEAAIDSYQPEKLKQAQEYIEKGNEHKMELLVSQKIDGISKKSMERFMEANKTFHEQYDEVISIPLAILKDKNWEEREAFLKTLPKNAENFRKILEAMDDGKFDEWNDKQK